MSIKTFLGGRIFQIKACFFEHESQKSVEAKFLQIKACFCGHECQKSAEAEFFKSKPVFCGHECQKSSEADFFQIKACFCGHKRQKSAEANFLQIKACFLRARKSKVRRGRFFSNQSLFLRARIADGEALSFLHASDLASLFGNALSNAIEYEQTVEEEKRCIFLKVFRKGDLVAVHIENYCTAELTFGGDLPLTTKHDKENHGFGLKSIRYTAERYNGSVAVGRSGNLFTPDVLFPAPRER